MNRLLWCIWLFSWTMSWAQEDGDGLRVVVQKAGLYLTNSYLVVDAESRQGMIIDAGGDLPELVQAVKDQELDIKFIVLTHCHQDHVRGLESVRKAFPDAIVLFSREEWEVFAQYRNWRSIFAESLVAQWSAVPEMVELMDFDYSQVEPPTRYLEDDDTFPLGTHTVRVLKTPGHSRGSISLAIGNHVFCGDLILFSGVGFIDYTLGSKEDLVTSARRLYREFADEVVLHPGHGEASTIGKEKRENRNVTAEGIVWQ